MKITCYNYKCFTNNKTNKYFVDIYELLTCRVKLLNVPYKSNIDNKYKIFCVPLFKSKRKHVHISKGGRKSRQSNLWACAGTFNIFCL